MIDLLRTTKTFASHLKTMKFYKKSLLILGITFLNLIIFFFKNFMISQSIIYLLYHKELVLNQLLKLNRIYIIIYSKRIS